MIGPVIVLILSSTRNIDRASQLTSDFKLFFLPSSTNTYLPNCDGEIYAEEGPSTDREKGSTPGVLDCPSGEQMLCPRCEKTFVPYSPVYESFCKSPFAVIAATQTEENYVTAYRLPLVTVKSISRKVNGVSQKLVVISISDPPTTSCKKGRIKLIQNIFPVPAPVRSEAIPYVQSTECQCSTLDNSGYVLVFSSRNPQYSPSGDLLLNANMFVIPALYEIPTCPVSLRSSVYMPPSAPAYSSDAPVPAYAAPAYSPPPSAPVYSPAPSAPAYSPAPSSPAHSPAPPAPVYSPAKPAPVYSPAPSAQVYPPAPPAPVHSPAPSAPGYSPAPSAPVYSPAPSAPVYSPAPSAPVYSPAPSAPVYSPALSAPVYSPAPSPPAYSPAPSVPAYSQTRVYIPPPAPGYPPAPSYIPPSAPAYIPPPAPVYNPIPAPDYARPGMPLTSQSMYFQQPPSVYASQMPLPPAPPFLNIRPEQSISATRRNNLYNYAAASDYSLRRSVASEFESCLSSYQATCPHTNKGLPPNFRDFYCESAFAMVVALGVDFPAFETEKENPRIVPFLPTKASLLHFAYDNEKYLFTVTVSKPKYKSCQPMQNTHSGNLCSVQKALCLYEISKSPYPGPNYMREMLNKMDLYLPVACDSSNFESPGYGILLSQSRPYDLAQPMQLSQNFAFFPLPKEELFLPSCDLYYNAHAVPIPHPQVLRYNPPTQQNLLREVECYPNPNRICKECDVATHDYDIPCDAKFAALIEILESSAGPSIAETLTITRYWNNMNRPNISINITPNLNKNNHDHHEASDPLQHMPLHRYSQGTKCKYVVVRIVKDLLLEKSSFEGNIMNLIEDAECDRLLFKVAPGGFALLITKEPVLERTAALPLNGDATITRCILPGTTKISYCATSHTSTNSPPVYNPSPVPNQPIPNPSYIPVPKQPNEPSYNVPNQDPPIVISSVQVPNQPMDLNPNSNQPFDAPSYTPAPFFAPDSNQPTEPPAIYPESNSGNQLPGPSPIADSTYNQQFPPDVGYPEQGEAYGSPRESKHGKIQTCEDHVDSTCPVCREIATYEQLEGYCASQFVLMARSNRMHNAGNTCSNGSLISLYDITPNKRFQKAVFNILYTIPADCDCAGLTDERFIMVMFEDPTPISSPLRVQLSSRNSLILVPPGKLKLPACGPDERVTARSKNVTNQIVLKTSTDTELQNLLQSTVCPTIDHTCPKCQEVSISELEKQVCASTEVILLRKDNATNAVTIQRPFKEDIILTENMAENYTLDILVKGREYEHVCLLPLKKGKCQNPEKRYYYDAEQQVCSEFEFSGCNGNDNNFISEKDCEESCYVEDFCQERSLIIQHVAKSYDPKLYKSGEFKFALGNHCDCPQLLKDDLIYLITDEDDDMEEIVHLNNGYRLLSVADTQEELIFNC